MNLPKWVKSLLSGYPAAVAMVIAFWALAVTSSLKKSATSDETVHLAAGYSYWKHNDYRIDPENGNLPQRWMALPLLLVNYTFPRQAPGMIDEWQVGFDFLYNWGNDPDRLLFGSRAMIAVLGAGLGLLVYGWSRRLFGRAGGVISLVLYVFSTVMLANGGLGTSDMAASLCFLASAGCLWAMLHRLSLVTVAGSCLVMGALFVSKMSAPLIVPIGLILCVIRLMSGRPLIVAIGRTVQIAKRWQQAMVFLGAIILHALATWAIIWAFYGLRYSVVDASPDQQRETAPRYWERYLRGEFPFRSEIEFLSDHRLLPEGYLLGQAHVLKFSQGRPSFLNGQYSLFGWRRFFPYAFLVKTSLGVFVVLILAAVAGLEGWRRTGPPRSAARSAAIRRGLYRTAPLWVLLVVYWAFAVSSKMNIGHRHILPAYPPMFVLAGAAAYWFSRPSRAPKVMAAAALVFVAAECIWMWPHYLAYFNQLVGGPRNGYRHLVDSSLDWGQDVPGLKDWLDRNGLSNQTHTPVYLAYFGNGNPTYYGINAHRLPGFADMDLNSLPFEPLEGGVYCISATLVQTVLLSPLGRWTEYYEQIYQELGRDIDRLIRSGPEGRRTLAEPLWQERLRHFLELRMGRLCAYLRAREPDDNVGYSILIYRLSGGDVRQALYGPPVELLPERIPTKDRLLAE